MIAMRYGTLPIVRQTGGLADTVEAYNKYEKTGSGFGFLNINAHELLYTAKEAIEVYREDKDTWNHMVKTAMTGDYSWTRSAKDYEALYQSILEESR